MQTVSDNQDSLVAFIL